MKKIILITLITGIILTISGCGLAKEPSSSNLDDNDATIEETTTTSQEKETVSANKDEANYDAERIKVTKWDMTQSGSRLPLDIVIDNVTYNYAYNENNALQSIKGSDGTSVEINRVNGDVEVNQNGIIVKYLDVTEYTNYTTYSGFEYGGKKYTYQYDDMHFITGILDENNKLVAEYKYTYAAKGCTVEVINHTEDNIGDINSIRYKGHYYDEITGFAAYAGISNVVFGEYKSLKC